MVPADTLEEREAMPQHCPECGNAMVFTKRTERPSEDALGSTSTEGEERDLVAEDIDPTEARANKTGTLVCTGCGAQLAVPEP